MPNEIEAGRAAMPDRDAEISQEAARAMLAALLNLAEAMEGQNRDSPHSMRMAIPGWVKTARAAIAWAEA